MHTPTAVAVGFFISDKGVVAALCAIVGLHVGKVLVLGVTGNEGRRFDGLLLIESFHDDLEFRVAKDRCWIWLLHPEAIEALRKVHRVRIGELDDAIPIRRAASDIRPVGRAKSCGRFNRIGGADDARARYLHLTVWEF